MKYLWRQVALAICGAMLLASCAGAPAQEEAKALDSGVKGQVIMQNEGAAEGAFVYAYETGYNDLRVPTKWISASTAADGSYTLDLPPGSYYVVARLRASGHPKGYLVKGDYEGKFPRNPVEVKRGQYAPVNLSVEMLAGNFLLAPYLPDAGDMSISGSVKDLDGTPAEGAFVMVYKEREMIGLPAYLSKPADRDGGYKVVVAEPGTYYVAARKKYGGLPRKGEPYGTYDDDKEHKVVIGQKENITGVDIKLGPFPHDLAFPVPPAE